VKTSKNLYILIKQEIEKALQPRAGIATVPSGNFGAEVTSKSISDSINNLSQAMALLVGNRIAEGFEIKATDPPSAIVNVMPGKAILNGKCIETDDTKSVQIEMADLPKVVRLYLNSNLDIVQSATKRTDYLELGKIVLPSTTTQKITQDKDESSNNGYIVLSSDALYDIDRRIDDETISYFRNTLRQVLASSLVGDITLSEGLQIKNTQGTLEMDSKEIRIKSADNSTLAKFTRDGTFFYDANGQLLASYRKDGATIGNIKITGHSIESINFEEGVKGFRIKDTGEVELENAKVRGEINAESGEFGGILINEDGIQSANYEEGVSGFKIDKLGNIKAFSVTLKGFVHALGGILGQNIYVPNGGIIELGDGGTLKVGDGGYIQIGESVFIDENGIQDRFIGQRKIKQTKNVTILAKEEGDFNDLREAINYINNETSGEHILRIQPGEYDWICGEDGPFNPYDPIEIRANVKVIGAGLQNTIINFIPDFATTYRRIDFPNENRDGIFVCNENCELSSFTLKIYSPDIQIAMSTYRPIFLQFNASNITTCYFSDLDFGFEDPVVGINPTSLKPKIFFANINNVILNIFNFLSNDWIGTDGSLEARSFIIRSSNIRGEIKAWYNTNIIQDSIVKGTNYCLIAELFYDHSITWNIISSTFESDDKIFLAVRSGNGYFYIKNCNFNKNPYINSEELDGATIHISEEDNLKISLYHPILGGDIDFNGYQGLKMRMECSDTQVATPLDGMFWRDTVNKKFYIYDALQATPGWREIQFV